MPLDCTSMSFLAPQAYTKETLGLAFDWLQHQPATIREAATTPDLLVGLYLRAQRHGLNAAKRDASASSKKFLEDLQSLKKDFAAFDDSASADSLAEFLAGENSPETAETPTATEPITQPESLAPLDPPPQPEALVESETPQTFTPEPVKPLPLAATLPTSSHSSPISLDSQSTRTIQETKLRFNLQSDIEALRLLISIGKERIDTWK